MDLQACNLTQTLVFDPSQWEVLRRNAQNFILPEKRSILSCLGFNHRPPKSQRYDSLGPYMYLMRLVTLNPWEILLVDLKVPVVAMSRSQLKPKLMVAVQCTEDVTSFMRFTVELPKDARAALADWIFGLDDHNTFVIVVPRQASSFGRAVEGMKKMIGISSS